MGCKDKGVAAHPLLCSLDRPVSELTPVVPTTVMAFPSPGFGFDPPAAWACCAALRASREGYMIPNARRVPPPQRASEASETSAL